MWECTSLFLNQDNIQIFQIAHPRWLPGRRTGKSFWSFNNVQVFVLDVENILPWSSHFFQGTIPDPDVEIWISMVPRFISQVCCAKELYASWFGFESMHSQHTVRESSKNYCSPKWVEEKGVYWGISRVLVAPWSLGQNERIHIGFTSS